MPPTLSSAVVWPAKIHTPPPSPVLPAPTVTRMDPALPLVARSDPTEMLPLLPKLAVPELKLKRPDTAPSPALKVRNVILPLDCVDPYPDHSVMAPPERAVDSPANIVTLPPVDVVPGPTDTRILPLLPFVECPVPIEMLPLLPTLAVPELKLKRPDTPLSPEFIVRTVTEPLDVIEP